jgi:hypothetical protein
LKVVCCYAFARFFIYGASMVRRVSKREMLHRLDAVPYVRVHLESLRSQSARVTVDGVVCQVNFPRNARPELMRATGVYGNLRAIPVPIGNGYMPRGTKSGQSARRAMRHTDELPTIKIFDNYSAQVGQMFERFKQAHPFGSIVKAFVRRLNRQVAILDLGMGIQGRLEKGECLDFAPGSPVKWLPVPSVGDVVDVMIRDYIDSRRTVSVTLHTFARDTGFCNHAAGYRPRFHADEAGFKRLPWECK